MAATASRNKGRTVQFEDVRRGVASLVLAEIPKLLTLLDRTPVSATYGCFDRAYWHYRMMDFPCGMSQEFVLPLALVWSMDELPGNVYHRDPQIREYILAAIRFAARSAHADGSCDDYYPFERAAGAAAFSLFAILETLDVIELAADPEIDAFVQRRAHWLASHTESGRLSNHEALIVSCLERAGRRYPGAGFEAAMATRLRRLLSWQHAEGWFDEYGGADVGYLSLTIGLLADLDRRRPDLDLRRPLTAAIDFLANFVHPDGTVGGEYSSRSTLNFFPFGFEIAGAWHEDALRINNLALLPLVELRPPCYSDDRIIGHHLWGWLFTLREFRCDRPLDQPQRTGRAWFDGCGLLVDRTPSTLLVAALSRGGVYKYFADGRLVASDTGVTLALSGRGKVAVSHLGGATVAVSDTHIDVSGEMAWAKSTRLTPAKNIVLRIVMLGFGRFFPDLVRRLLQKVLVTGKSAAPFSFRRQFEKTAQGWLVRDEISAAQGWQDVGRIGISGHQSSTTTIMARVYQESQLVPFIDLAPRLKGLAAGDRLSFERHLQGGHLQGGGDA
jgi:hypothetical protein